MKRKPKTLLIIAAVAVMLVAATSAYGDDYTHESWNGWFNSGTLTYNDTAYTFVAGDNLVDDYTDGSQDRFCLSCVAYTSFACVETDDTIEVRVSTFTGSKPTVQEDQKEGRGNWTGTAVLKRSGLPPVNFTTIVGTWNTGDEYDDMYFDYDDYPEEDATYSAKWRVSNSDPEGLEGEGGSSGKLLE